MYVVGALHRAHHGHLAVAGNRDHSLRFDVELLLMRDSILAFNDSIGCRESFVDVTSPDQESLKYIVFAVKNFFTGNGLFNREHRRRFFILYLNSPGSVLNQLFAFRGDQENRFVAMPNLGLDQQRLIVLNERDVVVSGDVAIVDDYDARPVECGIHRDRFDSSSWNRTANRFSVEHAVKRDVINVARGARELIPAFFA